MGESQKGHYLCAGSAVVIPFLTIGAEMSAVLGFRCVTNG